MLTSVKIAAVASYASDGQELSELKKANFLFGANASGKTTISRVIAGSVESTTCVLTWIGNRELKRFVYNSDFVEANFQPELKGIFTLGAENAEIKAKIDEAQKKHSGLVEEIRGKRDTLDGSDGKGGKRQDLLKAKEVITNAVWDKIKPRDATFATGAFDGYRSKERFIAEVLRQVSSNTSALYDLDDLKTRHAKAFAKDLQQASRFSVPDFRRLLDSESDTILSKVVVGKADVDLGALIAKLGNSDWVSKGRQYLPHSDGNCPFCQQKLEHDLAYRMAEYFNEAYASDLQAIQDLADSYSAEAEAIKSKVSAVIANAGEFVDAESLSGLHARLAERTRQNLELIKTKRESPSKQIELVSLSELATDLADLIKAANVKVDGHNAVAANQTSERQRVTREVWRYIVEQVRSEVDAYKRSQDDLEKAIDGLERGIAQKQTDLSVATAELQNLERSVTSVQPTVDEINRLLKACGFSRFKLKTAGAKNESYQIVRQDGTPVDKTLSEGEKSFVTFLYFWHSIMGSETAAGVNDDRIVVFDDPVSSMDSETLFVVSTLIRNVIRQVFDGNGPVKQVFVLTHNVYFHREVTFNAPGDGLHGDERRTYWVVRRGEMGSTVTRSDKNPVQTAYKLLWDEISKPEPGLVSLQNTLRRILEYYFQVLGGQPLNGLPETFEGEDQIICRSLLSWLHSNSHNVLDDLHVAAVDGQRDNYLRIFHQIFVKTNHGAHYDMMTAPPAV